MLALNWVNESLNQLHAEMILEWDFVSSIWISPKLIWLNQNKLNTKNYASFCIRVKNSLNAQS